MPGILSFRYFLLLYNGYVGSFGKVLVLDCIYQLEWEYLLLWWCCYISCEHSNIFLLQWVASSSAFCFLLFPLKLIAILVKQQRNTHSAPAFLPASWSSESTKMRGSSHLYLFTLTSQQGLEQKKNCLQKWSFLCGHRSHVHYSSLMWFWLSEMSVGQWWCAYMSWTELLAFSTTFQLPMLFFSKRLSIRINYHFSGLNVLNY